MTALLAHRERRRDSRLTMPFVVTVRGTDRTGERFEIETRLRNLSARGLYVSLARRLRPGDRLFAVVHFSMKPGDDEKALRVAAQGVVQRVDSERHGRYGVAITFQRHRFLYAAVD